MLDTATDGVLMVDKAGRVLSANRSAEALFGYEAEDFRKLVLGDLFAPESRRTVLDYLAQTADDHAVFQDAVAEGLEAVRAGEVCP